MRLPITDQFMWDLYKYIEKADDVVNFLSSNKYRKASIMTGGVNPIFAKYRHDMGKRKFDKLVYYLKSNNIIKVASLQGNQTVMITKSGMSKVLKASFTMEGKSKRKDGKWIMVIFDVPQKHPKARELLRSTLRNLGYKIFQQSVWVCPYDISEKTEKLLQFYALDRYVKIFLVEKM